MEIRDEAEERAKAIRKQVAIFESQGIVVPDFLKELSKGLKKEPQKRAPKADEKPEEAKVEKPAEPVAEKPVEAAAEPVAKPEPVAEKPVDPKPAAQPLRTPPRR